jgi:hypothetical protein
MLMKILKKRGVKAFGAFDLRPGNSIPSKLTDAIAVADFVIVVLIGASDAQFYEMGVAAGLGKPVYLILDKHSQAPVLVRGHPYVVARLTDKDRLDLFVSGLVQDIKNQRGRKALRKPRPKKPSANFGRLRAFADAVEAMRAGPQELELVQEVERFLEATGVRMAANKNGARDQGVDFAIWIDGLTEVLGNPILVELKVGALTARQVYAAERRLQAQLAHSDAESAIFLYLDKANRRFSDHHSLVPLILRCDLSDFIREVSRLGLEKALLQRRNTIVHGARV